MQHVRIFEVSYKGPTNHRGARVKIKDLRNNTTVFTPYNHELVGAKEIAKEFLESKLIPIISFASTDTLYYLMTEDFSTMIK